MNLHSEAARASLITAAHAEAMRRGDISIKGWVRENGTFDIQEWQEVFSRGDVDLSWCRPMIALIRWLTALPSDDEDLEVLGCLLPRDDERELPGPESWSLIQTWGTTASALDDPRALLAAVVASESAAAVEANAGWLEPRPQPDNTERVT